MSFRRAGRMQHLSVGYAHARTRVLAIAGDTTITVMELETGEILSTHDIDPNRTYWRNTQRAPGRWPGALWLSHMSRLRCQLCRDSSHWWS
jgi:hypothetical protein